ncbi:aminopeptidase [candidate division KSB1 bacterium]|nr:aminopeptidase [candidate division KSB1 bacterium]
MKDPRFNDLARVLIHHSTALQKGEKILIEAIDIPHEMVIAIMRAAHDKGGIPFTSIKQGPILRDLYRLATEQSMEMIGKWEADRMAEMDAYIALRGSHNVTEMSDVPPEKMKIYQNHWWEPVHIKIRVPKTKWVVLRWPHPSMAQQAFMSTEKFEDFYFNVCTLDYSAMSVAMNALVDRMQATDKVRITGPGTDLSFSIKGMKAVKCDGRHNIPDGEVYTAPIRDSVNGTLHYTAKTIYQGIVHDQIKLEFKEGKIINASSDKTDALNKVLDTDKGARYIGEFSLGLNPYIAHPMLDILFDEKIGGSFHFTPGGAYDEADNGNKSKVHWDMVCIQTPEYGGGEIVFDDELIRKDGKFVVKDLEPLNPENLIP